MPADLRMACTPSRSLCAPDRWQLLLLLAEQGVCANSSCLYAGLEVVGLSEVQVPLSGVPGGNASFLGVCHGFLRAPGDVRFLVVEGLLPNHTIVQVDMSDGTGVTYSCSVCALHQPCQASRHSSHVTRACLSMQRLCACGAAVE
jgi:hypothetical protein